MHTPKGPRDAIYLAFQRVARWTDGLISFTLRLICSLCCFRIVGVGVQSEALTYQRATGKRHTWQDAKQGWHPRGRRQMVNTTRYEDLGR